MSTTHNILVKVTQVGLDQTNASIKGLATTSTQATKGVNALGGSFGKAQNGALRFGTNVGKLEGEEKRAVATTNQFGKSVDQAGQKTGGLAAKFQGNKGAIFAFVGMASAGMEAVGMFGMYQSAADKLSQAQAKVNLLEELGQKGTKEHAAAVQDATEAQRGYNFILRNVAMSFGDLVPFTLLAINAIVKMKETVAGSKAALDTAAQAATGLGTAAKNTATTGLTPMYNTAGQLTGGMGTLGTGFRNTALETDKLHTSSGQLVTGFDKVGKGVQANTKVIGTRGSGLVGGISALTLGMNESNKMSTKFSSAFRTIGEHFKAIPGVLSGVASGIASFFTNFGTHLTKLGGALKVAGSAAMGFSKTMMVALLSNPITAVIAGISAAVLALATDFGGIRTAVNNAGVAIGNAIPPLKGILEGIGGVANGALDYIANMMGVETQTQKVAKEAKLTEVALDPLMISLQKTIDLGKNFQELDQAVQVFANIRTAIAELHAGTDFATKGMVIGLTAFGTSFTEAMSKITVSSPQAATAVQHVKDTLKLLEGGGYTAAQAQEFLTLAVNALSSALGQQVSQEQNNIQSNQDMQQSTQNATLATEGLSEVAAAAVTNLQMQTETTDAASKATGDNAMALQNLLSQYNIVIPVGHKFTEIQTTMLNELAKAGPLLQDYSQHLKFNADATINWEGTVQSLAATHQTFTDQTASDWDIISNLIQTRGIAGYKEAIAAVEMMKVKEKERGEAAEQSLEAIIEKQGENSKSLTEMIDTAVEGGKKQTESEAKVQNSLAESRKKIQEKANELKIWDQIQGMSLKNQENAIKIQENANSVDEKAIFTLQELATQRGLDIKNIDQSSSSLLKYISNNKLVPPSLDEINAAIGSLIGQRQKDAQETGVQEIAYTALLKTMGSQIDTTNLTVEAMGSMVQTYDDIQNATKLATSDVAKWNLELEKEEKINSETIIALEDLAKRYGITIPDAIKSKGVPAMKEFIKESLKLGTSVEEAADKANKAIDSIANKASDALTNLVEEDIIKGDMDEVIDKFEEAGASLDTLAGKQVIIKPFLDDSDFTNKLQGLPEILSQTWADAEMKAVGGGQAVINAFTSGIIDHLGEEAQPVVDHINQIWTQVQATAPAGTVGADLIAMFTQALDNPSQVLGTAQKLGQAVPQGIGEGATGIPQAIQPHMKQGLESLFGEQTNFASAGQGLSESAASGYASGGHMFVEEGHKVAYELLKTYDPTAAEAYAKSVEIANQSGAGLAAGAGAVSQGVQTGINQPVSQNVSLIPNEAQTGLAPLQGIFSQAFLDASTQSTIHLNKLVTVVQTGIMGINTAAETYLGMATEQWNKFWTSVNSIVGQMDQKIATFVNNSLALFVQLAKGTASLLTVFQNLQTGVDHAFGTMDQKILKFVSNTQSNFNKMDQTVGQMDQKIGEFADNTDHAFGTMDQKIKTWASNTVSSFKQVTSQANTATNAVKALASAINSLKSKSIEVYVGLTGPGVGYMRHGGSSLNFPSESGVSYAAGGKTWLQKTPKKIGGTPVAETFPEIISAIPLDPKEKASPFHNIDLPMSPMPTTASASNGGIGGGSSSSRMSGGGSPVQVRGDLYVTVKTQSGKVLATEIQPYLLDGFSGTT
jgi:hypothetical protein